MRDGRHVTDRRAKCDERPRRAVRRSVPAPAPSSAALREASHVALGAALDEGELRSAVGAGANEVLRGPGALTGGPLRSGGARPGGRRSGRPRAAQRGPLGALLLLPPFRYRDAACVAARDALAGPSAAR